MTEQKLNVGGTSVTLNPSEKLKSEGTKEISVTDSLGRVIILKKPDPLSGLDFTKAAGSGTEGVNILYLSEVAHLKYVAAIDGDPVITPSTDGELRALYKWLGDEGNSSCAVAVAKHFMEKAEDKGAALKKS